MIKSGRTFEEIVKVLPQIQNRITVYYVVDTLKYLTKGYRIGKVSGTIGEILNIKPIISINEEGVYYTYSKEKGKKKCILKINKNMLEKWNLLRSGHNENSRYIVRRFFFIP
jgi:DegV family protein with EDD domain